MARSVADVQKNIIANINSIDPSIDVSKGPVYDMLLRPFAPESANLEGKVENLTLLYSKIWNKTATDAEVAMFGTSFSIDRGAGTYSKGYVYFYRYTKPNKSQVIEIPVGTVVTNTDSTLAYATTSQGLMSGDYADSYFNSTKNVWEIRLPVKAVSAGSNYDIASYRLINISNELLGIDGVENRSAITGGKDIESIDSWSNRIITRFQGLDTSNSNGIVSLVKNYDPSNFQDASVIYPKDRTLFTRRTTTPAMDVYIIGSDEVSEEYVFTAVGGELEIYLEKSPVIQVDSVQVNGLDVDFSFIPDSNSDTKKSARARDKVILTSALISLDIVVIKYIYNQLIYGVQQDVFTATRHFNTDILARSALGAYVTFQASAKLASSVDPVSKLTEIETTAINLIQNNKFNEVFIPNDIRDAILSSVSGILDLSIIKFTRTVNGVLDIETINFNANETPIVDDTTFNISVRQ